MRLDLFKARIDIGHELIVAGLNIVGGIDIAGAGVSGQLGNLFPGGSDRRAQPAHGFVELPGAVPGAQRIGLGLIGGAQLAVQMDDVIADGDDVLAGLDNGSHIFGHGHAASIDGIHIISSRDQYIGHLLYGAIGAAQCFQRRLEGVPHRTDKAGLLNVDIIVI